MSIFIDIIRGMLGLGAAPPKDDFANLNPDDLEAYWTASEEIDRAERAGNVHTAYAKYGIKNESHWDEVMGSFVRRHGQTPEFSLAASTASFRMQLADLSQPTEGGVAYRMPSEYLEPVDGVSLDKLVIAKVKTEGMQQAQRDAALASLGLDVDRFTRADQGWSARMGGNSDPTAAAMLSGLYHTYDAQVRAVYAR